MADIVIARIIFPNDPTNNLVAHQMFIGELSGKTIQLYSVSSIPGKEKRVFGPEKDHYITILEPEYINNGFKLPSFIDCSKMYEIPLSTTTDITKLGLRNISSDLKARIINQIAMLKARGSYTVYNITEEDFISWNPRLISQ